MRTYFLTSERVGFSTWSTADIDLANQLWGNPAVTKYISATGVFTKEEIEKRLALEISNQEHFKISYWPIFELKTQKFMGCCGLRPYNDEQGILEVGTHILPEFWGQGFATEAVKTIMDYAFHTLKAKNLFVGHNPKNTASKALIQKLGFRYTHDEFYPPTGLNHPSYLYK